MIGFICVRRWHQHRFINISTRAQVCSARTDNAWKFLSNDGYTLWMCICPCRLVAFRRQMLGCWALVMGVTYAALCRLKISAPHAGQFILSSRPPKGYLQPFLSLRLHCRNAQFRMYCLDPFIFVLNCHVQKNSTRHIHNITCSARRYTWRPRKSAFMVSVIIWFAGETSEIVSRWGGWGEREPDLFVISQIYLQIYEFTLWTYGTTQKML